MDKCVFVAACAFALLAGSANAQLSFQSRFSWDVSTNGGATWSSSVSALPGDTVTFRLRLSTYRATSPTSFGALAGFTILPNLTNWGGGDRLDPFASEQYREGSEANPVPSVIPGPYPLPSGTFRGPGVVGSGNGRQAPYGSNGTNGNGVPIPQVVDQSLRLVAPVADYRGVSFAQLTGGLSNVMAWDGHTYISSETGELMMDPPAEEISSGLWTEYQDAAGSFFRTGTSNLVVFLYSITLDSADTSNRTLVQSGNIIGSVQYYSSAASSGGRTTAPPNNPVQSAQVQVVPAPGSLILLAGLLAVRRRR